jgi:hypothetical protein
MTILSLLTIVLASAFNLIPDMNVTFPKVLTPCDNITPVLFDTAIQVCSSISQTGYEVILSSINSTGTICQSNLMPDTTFGLMILMVSGLTHITINNDILHLPNTLYNVLYHEILHSVGLDHSEKEGLMNYSVPVGRWFGRVYPMDDTQHMYPSVDDLSGLYSIY